MRRDKYIIDKNKVVRTKKRELAIMINKKIGEDGHIRQDSFIGWTPYAVAVYHPFIDGNKRTAFIMLQLEQYKIFYNGTDEEIVDMIIKDYKDWINILKEC